MTDRSALRTTFLTESGWGNAVRHPLAGDASNRRYDRLIRDGETVVLMDAPPEKGEDVEPFVKIATFLSRQNLSAPRIIAQDIDYGFLLIEDLGDDLFARLIEKDSTTEVPLYIAAVDVLVHLHTVRPPEGIAVYSPPLMASLAALAVDWYANEGPTDPSDLTYRRVKSSIEALLQCHAAAHTVLIQRDYHSENLLWLPDRSGPARVGLLDFQDAMAGHPAYDLASLLTDARRDVSAAARQAALDHYIAETGTHIEAFETAYAVLALQRNLRILGVFARLSLHYNKPHYVDLIPRVWGHIQSGLDHPALSCIKPLILEALPPPDPSKLEGLKEKCGTIPTR